MLHNITDTMIKTAEKNAETIACQSRTIHNLIVDNDRLRTELAAANAKVEALYAELEKAHDINFNLIETVAQLSEKLPEDDELFDEDPAMY